MPAGILERFVERKQREEEERRKREEEARRQEDLARRRAERDAREQERRNPTKPVTTPILDVLASPPVQLPDPGLQITGKPEVDHGPAPIQSSQAQTTPIDVSSPRLETGPLTQEQARWQAIGRFGTPTRDEFGLGPWGQVWEETTSRKKPEPEPEPERPAYLQGSVLDAFSAWRNRDTMDWLGTPFISPAQAPEPEEQPMRARLLEDMVGLLPEAWQQPVQQGIEALGQVDWSRGTNQLGVFGAMGPQAGVLGFPQWAGEMLPQVVDSPSFDYEYDQFSRSEKERARETARRPAEFREAFTEMAVGIAQQPLNPLNYFNVGKMIQKASKLGPMGVAQDVAWDQLFNLAAFYGGTLNFLHTTPPDEAFQRFAGTYDGTPGSWMSFMDLVVPYGTAFNQVFNPFNFRTSETFWVENGDPDGGMFGTGLSFTNNFNLGTAQKRAYEIAHEQFTRRAEVWQELGEVVEEYPESIYLRNLSYSDANRIFSGINDFIAKKEQAPQMMVQAHHLEQMGDSLGAAWLYSQAYQLMTKPLLEIVDDNQSLPGYLASQLADPIDIIGAKVVKGAVKAARSERWAFNLVSGRTPEQVADSWRAAVIGTKKQPGAIAQLDRLYGGQLTDADKFRWWDTVNPMKWLEQTPTTKADGDFRILHEVVTHLIGATENPAQAKHLLNLLTSEAAPTLFRDGVSLINPATVDPNALQKFGAETLANASVLERWPVLMLARDKLLGMRSLSGKTYDVSKVAEETAGILHVAARQYHGLANVTDLPYNAASVNMREVRPGRWIVEWLDAKGATVRTSLPDTEKNIKKYYTNIKDALDNKLSDKNPVTQLLDFQANIQREYIGTNYFALSPIAHTIQNAGTAYFMGFAEDTYTWLRREVIGDWWNKKGGGFAPSVKMGEISEQLSGKYGRDVRDVAVGRTMRNALDKIPAVGKTLGKIIDWGFSIPYGKREIPLGPYAISISEESFRAKNYHAAGTRFFRRYWNDAVDEVGNVIREVAPEAEELVSNYVAAAKKLGFEGGRRDVAVGLRKLLEQDTIPVNADALNIPHELLSMGGRQQFDSILARATPENIGDLTAELTRLFDDEVLTYARLLTDNFGVSTPNIGNWQKLDNVREGAQLHDYLMESARRAGLNPEEAAVRVKEIAGVFENGYNQAFNSIRNNLFAADPSPAWGNVLTDFYHDMMRLKNGARELADTAARRAMDENNAVGWARHLDETENIWKQYADNLAKLAEETEETFRTIVAGGDYAPKQGTWESIVRRYTTFDPEEFNALRQIDASLADPETYERIINLNRHRMDAAYSEVIEAMRHMPTQNGFDLFASLWKWSDVDGAATKARALGIRQELFNGAISKEKYITDTNRIWRQHFDNAVAYAEAVRDQILGHGLSERSLRDLVYQADGVPHLLSRPTQWENVWRVVRLTDGETLIRADVPREIAERYRSIVSQDILDFKNVRDTVVDGARQLTPEQPIGAAGERILQEFVSQLDIQAMGAGRDRMTAYVVRALNKDLGLELKSVQELPSNLFEEALGAIRRRAPEGAPDVPFPTLRAPSAGQQYHDTSLAKALGLGDTAKHADVVEALKAFFTESHRTGGVTPFDYSDMAAASIRKINEVRTDITGRLPELARGVPNQLTPAQKRQIVKAVDEQLLPRFDDVLTGARTHGNDMAHFIMLNYNDRRYADEAMNWMGGYWYFLSRMPSRYVDVSMRHPGLLHKWDTHNQVLEADRQREDLPVRFRNTYPNVLAEKFGGAEEGMTRRPSLLHTVLPFNVYVNPSPFAGIREAASEGERTVRSLDPMGFRLPFVDMALDLYFDYTDPQETPRMDRWQISDFTPLLRMASAQRQSATGEPIGGWTGFWRGGNESDPYAAAAKAVQIGVREEITPQVVEAAQVYIENLQQGIAPLDGIPPELASQVEELAEQAIKEAGTETLHRLMTHYLTRSGERTFTPEDQQLTRAGQQYHAVGYDPVRNPLGSREDQREVLDNNPLLPAHWNRVSLLPNTGREPVRTTFNRNEFYRKQSGIYDEMNEALVAAILENPELESGEFWAIREPFDEQLKELRKEYEDVPQLEGSMRGRSPREKTQMQIEKILQFRPENQPVWPGENAKPEEKQAYYEAKAKWDKERYDHVHDRLWRMAEQEEPYSDQHNIARQMLEGLYASDLIRQYTNRFAPQQIFDWAERQAFIAEVDRHEWAEREQEVREILGEEGFALYREYMDADQETRQELMASSSDYRKAMMAAFNTEEYQAAVKIFGGDWYSVYANAPDHPGDEASPAQLQAYYDELGAYKRQFPDYEAIRLWYNGRPKPEGLQAEFLEEYGYWPRDYGQEFALLESEVGISIEDVLRMDQELQAFIQAEIAANPGDDKAGGRAYYQWHQRNPEKSLVLGAYDGWYNALKKEQVPYTYEDLVKSQQVSEEDKRPGLETYTGPRPFGSDMQPIVAPGEAGTPDRRAQMTFTPDAAAGIRPSDQQRPDIIDRELMRSRDTPTPDLIEQQMTEFQQPPDIVDRQMQQRGDTAALEQMSQALKDLKGTILGDMSAKEVEAALESLDALRAQLEPGETIGSLRGTDPVEIAATQERNLEEWAALSDRDADFKESQWRTNMWDKYNACGERNWACKRNFMLDNPEFAAYYLSLTDKDGNNYTAWWLNWNEGGGGRGTGGINTGLNFTQRSAHWDAFRPLSTAEKAEYLKNNPDFAAYYLANYADEDWWTDYVDMSGHWDAYRPLDRAGKIQYMLDNPDFAEYYNNRWPESANWWLRSGSSFTPWRSFGGGGWWGGSRDDDSTPGYRPLASVSMPSRRQYAQPQRWRPENISTQWLQAGASLGPRR